jgi:hypothetical protein
MLGSRSSSVPTPSTSPSAPSACRGRFETRPYAGGDGEGLPCAWASASKIRSAGNSQGKDRGHSFISTTSFGHLPDEMSLLTSTTTTTTASRSG